MKNLNLQKLHLYDKKNYVILKKVHKVIEVYKKSIKFSAELNKKAIHKYEHGTENKNQK